MRKSRYAIGLLIVILLGYLAVTVFSRQDINLAARMMKGLGRLAVNTFCPASLYDKHLYYLEEDKRAAVIMFGNIFPVVRYLSIGSEEEEGDMGKGSVEILWNRGIPAYMEVSGQNTDKGYGSENAGNGENPSEGAETEGEAKGGNEKTTEGSPNEEMNTSSENGTELATEKDTVGSEVSGGGTNGQSDSEAAAQISRPVLAAAENRALSYEQLTDYDYLYRNFYVVPSHTALPQSLLQPERLINIDMSISSDKRPCILLYHTHSQEAFKDSYGKDMTIVQVGDYLEKLLTEQYGCEVMHITTQFDMKEGSLDRSKAYTYAQEEIGQIIAEHPEIDMVIDLHRDGVNENLHFVTEINGKATAKIMLFNGISYSNNQGNIDYLYNPYLTENLALTYQIYALGKNYYPDFIRCIYIEAYRYNLHLCRRSMLIEAGAQTNTFEEVKNAMEPLAELIYRELSGEKIY